MPLPKTKLALIAASLVVTCLATSSRGEEWPQYRGPKQDGIVRDEKVAAEWPAGGPKELWKVPVGIGHASPIALDGKLYLFTRDEEKNQEVLTAIDAPSGHPLWSQNYEGGYTHQNKDWRGTRATPAISGDRIYTYGGSGDLFARQLADGKEVWHVNVLKETNAKPIEWGEASSPLIEGDAIYVQGGRGAGVPVAVAVNKADGKLIWQSDAKGEPTGKAGWPTGGGYAQPLLVTVGGIKQLIVLGGTAVYGMEPTTGKTIWSEPWVTNYDVNATTPIYQDPNLFISSGYGHGDMMLELSAGGAKKLWENNSLQSRFPGVVLDRGYLYVNSEGTLKCASWADGKVAWEVKDPDVRLGPGGSFVRFGDHLILISERGKLVLAKATPEGFTKIAAKQVTRGSNIWATPLIYHGKLYVKGVEELICFDVSAK